MDVLYFLADYCYITITSNLPLKIYHLKTQLKQEIGSRRRGGGVAEWFWSLAIEQQQHDPKVPGSNNANGRNGICLLFIVSGICFRHLVTIVFSAPYK